MAGENKPGEPLEVSLGERSYPIHIGSGLLGAENIRTLVLPHVRGNRAAIISNPTVDALYGESLRNALADLQVDTHLIPDGEAFKSLDTYAGALDFLMAGKHNRTSCVLALGGGVVGDLAGFVAATYQRGVDFVQIPTTLLSQVDSSVGGKTAVNHPAGKNMIGAFYQPRCVLIDIDVLSTLPPREYAAGLAEVVKYGVIADAGLFDWLEEHHREVAAKEPAALAHIIRRSCEIKARVVAADERESGVRAILNFGHTFGHAIENLAGYGTWLHGEAVAVGMVMAAEFSERLNRLPQGQAARLGDLLKRFDLPVELTEAAGVREMLDAMGMDKKVEDGQLRFVVADRVGNAVVTGDYEQEVLVDLLQRWCNRDAG